MYQDQSRHCARFEVIIVHRRTALLAARQISLPPSALVASIVVSTPFDENIIEDMTLDIEPAVAYGTKIVNAVREDVYGLDLA